MRIFGKRSPKAPASMTTAGPGSITPSSGSGVGGDLRRGPRPPRPDRDLSRSRAPGVSSQQLAILGPMRKVKRGTSSTARPNGWRSRAATCSRPCRTFPPRPRQRLRRRVGRRPGGFLASRVGHPYFAVEAETWPDTSNISTPRSRTPCRSSRWSSSRAGRSSSSSRNTHPGRGGERRLRADLEPVGWSSWYHYFTELRWADVEKNLRIAARVPLRGFPDRRRLRGRHRRLARVKEGSVRSRTWRA